jgi:16S rRNA (cytosine1402-N4)-methyltransferase
VEQSEIEHVPVLAERLAEQVDLPPDGVMVDATIGHGGHSLLFGRRLGPQGVLVGFDVDPKSLDRARSRLAGLACRVILVHSNFAAMAERLAEADIDGVDFILADLGLCSAQLADERVGLSFQANMPLDMRIDASLETTAADIVNEYDEKSLADVIYAFGQERASRRIARYIVQRRQHERISTTGQLVEIICGALRLPPRRGPLGKHPATRTFQALRIAVNHELDNLESLLDAVPALLKDGGRLAIISYHSLEDGRVKRDFKEKGQAGVYRVLTKKPIAPGRAEILANRRARSAKLRMAQKVGH